MPATHLPPTCHTCHNLPACWAAGSLITRLEEGGSRAMRRYGQPYITIGWYELEQVGVGHSLCRVCVCACAVRACVRCIRSCAWTGCGKPMAIACDAK